MIGTRHILSVTLSVAALIGACAPSLRADGQGCQSVSIGAQDGNWHSFKTKPGHKYRISFNFSEHCFDSKRGEPLGWRQQYAIDYGGKEKTYLIEVGSDLENSNIDIPCSSQTFLAPGERVRVKVVDSFYEDNQG
ncbi:MAG: hypothetical protein FD180_3681 [Planctomycetota bacterium]|nr:MAG: hypothetical protein FD180_3681 [Planctomycetota bacterium]